MAHKNEVRDFIRGKADSRLGFGELSTPDVARFVGRVEFFAAIERVAGDVLVELRATVLPLYSDAMQNSPPDTHSDMPSVILLTATGKYTQESLLSVTSWALLQQSRAASSHLTALHDGIDAWSNRYYLTDDWFRESLFRILGGWHRGEASWSYPGSVGWSDQSFVVSGAGLDGFALRGLKAPPPYNPLIQTRDQYRADIEQYCQKQERRVYKILPDVANTRNLKRPAHYDWLVQYQVLGWNYTEVARHVSDDIVRMAIVTAVTEKADIIGLVLRPSRRGRPRTKKAR